MSERDIPTPDGRTLYVYEAGDPSGELVVAHHGTPGAGLLPGPWARDAANMGVRLVSYDRPGYGGSTRHPGRSVADAAADTAVIADALGVDRFYTCGSSGGGPHALACAALLPDRVIAVVATASVAPYTADGLDWLAGMGADNLEEFAAAEAGQAHLEPFLVGARADVIGTDAEGLVSAMKSLLPDVDAAALTGEWGDFMVENFGRGLRPGIDGWLDDDLAFVRGWGFDLASITMPVLVRQGRLDLMVPFAHGEWLAAHVPTAQPEMSDVDGHLTLIAEAAPVYRWLTQIT